MEYRPPPPPPRHTTGGPPALQNADRSGEQAGRTELGIIVSLREGRDGGWGRPRCTEPLSFRPRGTGTFGGR